MLLAGSFLDRVPGPKYSGQLRFAELGLRAPLPRAPTLRRMRHELPDGFTLALRAPLSTLTSARGPLRFDDALERSFEWLLAAREALAAKIVVLPTPADLTPGARDRELLAAFAARLPRESGRHFVWAPNGPWEVDDAERVATSLDMVLAFDPLLAPLPSGPLAYARLRALGARQSFSDAVLEDVQLLLQSDPARECYAAIDAERSFDYAVRLQKLADAGPDAAGPDAA
jgi:uncharacterized protein YecE (DUF72 family)